MKSSIVKNSSNAFYKRESFRVMISLLIALVLNGLVIKSIVSGWVDDLSYFGAWSLGAVVSLFIWKLFQTSWFKKSKTLFTVATICILFVMVLIVEDGGYGNSSEIFVAGISLGIFVATLVTWKRKDMTDNGKMWQTAKYIFIIISVLLNLILGGLMIIMNSYYYDYAAINDALNVRIPRLCTMENLTPRKYIPLCHFEEVMGLIDTRENLDAYKATIQLKKKIN